MTDPTPAAPPPSDDAFRQLLAECIDTMGRGGTPAVEERLRAAPEHAAAIRERLAKLVRAGLLAAEPEGEPEIPERLGEYRLLSRLGAGGMGVVYLAEQGSLGRKVALKLLRPEQRFFPGARERFRREVEAIARLGDPGIVPIYAVGEAEGIAFFTMEHVQGASLADAIAALHGEPPQRLTGRDLGAVAAARAGEELPERLPELFAGSWVAACCRAVAAMAKAAQHAHERGVVHRDLKPSNAMVTPDGRVRLLDFGLAAAEGTLRLTRTGAQLGTLHYMAPEQLENGETDARTDVYALGVSLHELLALEAPFHEASAERLRAAILTGVPKRLVARNPEVPRDVATICARAMERDPARRYPTAQALADDLERFLSHRPIEARPAGPMLRLRRWCQRHPTAATAVVLLTIAAAAVPVVVHVVRHEEAVARALAETTARQNLQLAVDAIAQMVTQARSAAMTSTPGLDPVRLRQLDDAVARLRALAAGNAEDPQVRSLLARGLLQAARVRQGLGQDERALEALAEAEPLLERLRTELPKEVGLRDDHEALLLTRASAFASLNRFADAEALWRRLIDEAKDLDVATASAERLLTVTSCRNNLSRLLGASGQEAQALAELQAALPLDTRVRQLRTTNDVQIDSARLRVNIGTLQRKTGKIDEALATYRGVLSDLTALAAANGKDPEVVRETARVRFAMATIGTMQKRPAEAAPLRQQALAALRELVAGFPDRTAYRQELGSMAFQASCDAQEEGDRAAAETLAREAVASHGELVARQPGPEARTDLGTFERQLANLLLLRGERAGALALLEQAIARQRQVVVERPDDPHYRISLASLLQELGIHHWRAEAWPKAREAWRAAVEVYDAVLAAGVGTPKEPRRLPMLLQVLAQAELMCDDFEGVVRALARLQQVRPLDRATLAAAGEGLHVADRADFQALLEKAPVAPDAHGAGK